ncbi:PREDICTED: coiled-coil domain-containing protein 33, partial [Tauraco erythrolophus]|uniref:coiled-coil domain-containing protein 33 n=1 Tax=Tauraco erythrolophus TaxID=121530 RepID=UPI0005238986
SQGVIRDQQERRDTRGKGDIGSTGGVSSVPKEVSSYRLALERMAGDILSLRQHVASLEVENGHLRRSLALQEELGHASLADVDLDVVTREELLDRLGGEDVAWALAATFKRKLAANMVEMRRLKDRVQQLQNELIRKNDREKELVLLQRAPQQQKATLQRRSWLGQVEELRSRQVGASGDGDPRGGVGHIPAALPPHPADQALSGEVYTVLLAENRRLRDQLEKAPFPSAPIAPRPPALPLEEAARRWGRQKQELGTRLLEQEHGST